MEGLKYAVMLDWRACPGNPLACYFSCYEYHGSRLVEYRGGTEWEHIEGNPIWLRTGYDLANHKFSEDFLRGLTWGEMVVVEKP